MSSLRARLLAGTTLAVASVLVLAGWSLDTLVERGLVGEVDRALEARARLLASTVEQEGEELELAFHEIDMSDFAAPERGWFLELFGEDGERLYRSESLGDAALAPGEAQPAWIDLPPADSVTGSLDPGARGGARGRAITLRFRPRLEVAVPGVEARELTLVVACDAREVDRTLATLRGGLALVGLVTLVVAGVVLVVVVRRSLRPVGAVAERIETIGERSLATRLEEEGVPAELVPVVRRVNELLARLDAAFARERAFSAEVAHELRTPLAGLRTTLEVNGDGRSTERERIEALRASAGMVEGLQAMVERLLHLARLDAERPAGDEEGGEGGGERFDLADLVVEAWEPFAARAQARGLQVRFGVDTGLDAQLDRELVALILRNLYENAVAYSDAGGHVRIAARRTDGEVRLEVTSTGSRLDQAQAEAATQRFWRGDASRTEVGVHSGLGLALVEKAADALGGRLELRSQVGGDFVAAVTLPAARVG